MEYRVDLSPRALSDIDGIVGHIHQNSPANALRFRQRLLTKIGNLANFVLTVRHGARREMPSDELDEANE
jgi:plasmid stabilization system protein ParE